MRVAAAVFGVSSFFVFGACGGATGGDGNPESGGGPSETGGRAPTGGAGGAGGLTPSGGAGGLTPSGGAGGLTPSGGAGGYGGTGGSSCFAAGTAITTPRGKVAIERLRVGDVVLGYDEGEHRVVQSPVTAVFVHPDQHPGTLTTGDGRVLRVTGEHPIYIADDGRYVPAADLAGDERLLALDARGNVQSSIGSALLPDASGGSETVYNITVAGVHNYFAEGVLVHNKSGGAPCTPQAGPESPLLCDPPADCINPNRRGEFIQMNQPVGQNIADAGAALPDAGEFPGSDAAPAPGVWANVFYCASPDPSVTSSYIAFDTLTPGGFASFEVYTGDLECGRGFVGEVWLSDHDAPPPNTWTTQCVELSRYELHHSLLIYTDTPGAVVRNPRFVTGCECLRALKKNTTCGYRDSLGNGGGSACL